MTRLTARMQAIADAAIALGKELSKQDPVAADIGCDHAFVSIALAESGTFAGVIACDIVPGPLQIARSNIASSGLSDTISVRMGDGLSPLAPKEADVAVIAGMGGHLMEEILGNGSDVLAGGIGLILSPQSEPERVRYYLTQNGYEIRREQMVEDNHKFYTVITATTGEGVPLTEVEARFGRDNIMRKDPVFLKYIDDLIRKNRKICDGLARQGEGHERLAELEREYEEMRKIIEI